MSDDRRVDELSLEELEAVVEERRRLAQARAFDESEPGTRFRPITVQPEPAAPVRRIRRPRGWRDNLLLLVEVAAVVGLIVIIFNSLGTLQKLNQAAAVSQGTSAGTPAPSSDNPASGQLPASSFAPGDAELGRLPGSSSPPDALPVALGVEVTSVPALPPPTAGPESPTRIVIPKLSLDWPVVEGDDWEALKRGVGHHVGSANPGERGNLVLSGHDDIFGEVFKDLGRLENDDLVIVYAGGHAYRYGVRAKRTVSPQDLSVLAATREPVVTLITCTPYGVDTMRLIVIAQLIS